MDEGNHLGETVHDCEDDCVARGGGGGEDQ